MMTNKDTLADRIGKSINQLDIDFSSFTLAGWLVSVASLALGGGIAFVAYRMVANPNGGNQGPALVFGLTMIGVTVISFLALRFLCKRLGLPVTHPPSGRLETDNANRDTLARMANAGMDLSQSHVIDFWHRFPDKDQALHMARAVKTMGFNVGSIERNEESGGFDVQVRVEMIPTLSSITSPENKLAAVAEAHGGHADGWGVLQS